MVLHYSSRTRTRRVFKTIIGLGLAFFLFNTFHPLIWFSRRYDTWPWDSCPGLSPFNRSCTASRASIAPYIQIVVETGGSEPQSRLQYQLTTMLFNVPSQNILILSDLEEDIGSIHIHDVYADISRQERDNYPEFALYDKLKTYQRLGEDTRLLEGGWKLAKYKKLAMKRKMWKMQQETGGAHMQWKWFVFIDTDTFIEWDNLLAFLEHFDPRKKLYMGSPVWLPNLQFAHGGSAYILSYGAMESLNMHDREGSVHSQFGLNTTALCCGDQALAIVLKQRGIHLSGYWPMFNGEIPNTVKFGREIWCEPVLSLHHLIGTDMEDLYRWVEDWKARTMSMRPFLFRDLFEYVAPRFTSKIKDWDNTEDAFKLYQHRTEIVPFTSFEQCEAACEADKLCFQFVSHGTACALSHTIRFGHKRLPENEGESSYISGWNLKRIQDWTTEAKCSTAHWLRSNP